MNRVVPIGEIPMWQREAVLQDWVKWVVVREGKIDSGHRTLKEANNAAKQ